MSKADETIVTVNAIKAYITFQTNRQITALYKSHLSIIQDITKDHHTMMKKLKNYVDPEVLENVDYLTEEKYNYIRKKTLDIGNEAIREFEAKMEKVEIHLKQ